MPPWGPGWTQQRRTLCARSPPPDSPSPSSATVNRCWPRVTGICGLGRAGPGLREHHLPAGLHTKQFTAAAILHLAEEGKLSLEDRISDYLPDYPDRGGRITIRNLLSHTSGLSDVAILPILEEAGGVGYTRDEIIDLVASQPLDFEPGTGHSYSNVGFMLAGVVIERVTGTTYADYLTNEILRPLGLDQTSFCPDEQPRSDRWAHGYDLQHGTWPRALRLGRAPAFVDPAPINMEVVSSAGALCSTVTDLARWPGLLRSFLDPASYREMSEPTVLADGTRVPYGLGLQIREFGSHPALSHGGVVTGFISVVAHFPETT
jgi:D-alanyl-D-alanine carboxypeptidase